ncbi:hypothetical protein [uncultured Desulfobacter sp.]|uniref:hypothetical protein n=1 Tax=uncultured Desulfobacter sp. TaxID=240139 RepID=UPI0029C8C838|nr:hypothetical protein [uncultured Desulfobacter sp.]
MNISSRRAPEEKNRVFHQKRRQLRRQRKENGWFAARPSGTEDIYKIYTESFKNKAHLQRIQQEAQTIVSAAFQVAGV